jgi:hypothetical protein
MPLFHLCSSFHCIVAHFPMSSHIRVCAEGLLDKPNEHFGILHLLLLYGAMLSHLSVRSSPSDRHSNSVGRRERALGTRVQPSIHTHFLSKIPPLRWCSFTLSSQFSIPTNISSVLTLGSTFVLKLHEVCKSMKWGKSRGDASYKLD